MYSPNRSLPTRGFTLIELLAAILISTILVTGATSMWSETLKRQKLVSSTNQLLGFLYFARGTAMTHGGVLLCSELGNCERFLSGNLILTLDKNDNRRLDDNEAAIAKMEIEEGVTIYWKSFRRKPWLHYNQLGQTYYQSGHFLVCSGGYGRKVVLNNIGRLKISRNVPKTACPESD
jgi:type IV fimbrial biogenesis protein FimT